ncbi:MAG: metal-dependent hydrolase [Rhizobiaceae bacterium]
MLIAHLPAGYLVGRLMERAAPGARGLMAAALVGSVVPDFDMAYFYFVDGGRTHHHKFFTHWPLFWLVVSTVAVTASSLRPSLRPAVVAASLSVMLHMILDSVAAPMWWLMPFSDQRIELFPVPATFSDWRLSFVTHWTFLVELAICVTAATLLFRRGRRHQNEA